MPGTQPDPSAESVAPPRSTRERILDIALELFVDRGYDATSLRDIAERLGTTKAALYYHFERKQDIFLELHLRFHELARGPLAELEALDAQGRIDAWPGLVDRFGEEIIAHRELILLHQRNATAFRQLEADDVHEAENADLQRRIRGVLDDPGIPLDRRVRMIGSIGLVLTIILSSDSMFADASLPELAEHARAAARDLLGAPAA
jgi:AcrR family transcriptional regulator